MQFRCPPAMPMLAALLLLPAGIGGPASSIIKPASQRTVPAADTGRKLALIIAIGKYPRSTGYQKLSSANDVPLIRAALERQGFDSTGIRVLTDSEATRAGILQALEALVAEARPGDVVLVHYSGHGHQMTDDNGDELDGLDELWVPFDARSDVDPVTYKGEYHLKDDQLEPILQRLRQQVSPGGNVVVFIDACHSGSATRSAMPVRGGLPPIGKPAATRTVTRGDTPSGSGWLTAPAATRGGSSGVSGLAPMVVFSAAREDQLATEVELKGEDKTAGSLSVGLSHVLAALSRADGQPLTYRAVFDQLKSWMQGEVPLQVPQLEGDADVAVFSGRAVTQKPYFHVASVLGDSIAVLEGGSLVGLLPGSKLSFYPLGTQDPAKATAVGSGEVATADELEARVRLAPGTRAGGSWAFVTEYAFAEFRVRLKLDPAIVGPARAALAADLEHSGVIQLSDSLAEMVVHPVGPRSRGAAALTVSWSGDTSVALVPSVDASTAVGRASLTERIRALARSSYLKQVQMAAPGIRVRIELVPATHHFEADGSCDARKSDTLHVTARLSEGSQWLLRPNDGYFLRFINEGADSAYIAVLDLTPDGAIGQLFPRADLSGEDNLLPPGASYLSNLCFYATEPYGMEVVKLFATRSRVNFTPVLTSPDHGINRSAAHPLEVLLAETYSPTRGDPPAAPQGTGSTAALTLQVLPPAATGGP